MSIWKKPISLQALRDTNAHRRATGRQSIKMGVKFYGVDEEGRPDNSSTEPQT